MLLRRPPNIRPLLFCRCFSQQSSSHPFKKLRAYPFKISPQDAIKLMSPYASILHRKSPIPAIANILLPFLSFKHVQPTRITPLYFPSWVIDAEVQAEATVTADQSSSASSSEVTETVLQQFIDVYLPGNDFKVLSSVSLWTDPLRKGWLDSVPFTDDLLKQYGMDVTCLPYNISPFSVLDIAHSVPDTKISVDRTLTFSPQSVKPNMLAAYPILIPLYLAQYEFQSTPEDDPRYITAFMQAYPFAEIMVEDVPLGPDLDMVVSGTQKMMGWEGTHHAIKILGHLARFIHSRDRFPIDTSVANYLEGLISSPSAPQKLAASSLIESDEDPRIREWTDAERSWIRSWLLYGTEIGVLQRSLKMMCLENESTQNDAFEQAKCNLELLISDLKIKRAESLPDWWKEWEKEYPQNGNH